MDAADNASAPSDGATPAEASWVAEEFALTAVVDWTRVSLGQRGLLLRWYAPFVDNVVEREYQRYANSGVGKGNALLLLITIALVAPMIIGYCDSDDSMIAVGIVYAGYFLAAVLMIAQLPFLCCRRTNREATLARIQVGAAAMIVVAGTGAAAVDDHSCNGPSGVCLRAAHGSSAFVAFVAAIVAHHPLHLAPVMALLVATYAAVAGIAQVDGRRPLDVAMTSVYYGLLCICMACHGFIRDITTRRHFKEMIRVVVAQRHLTAQRNRVAQVVKGALPARVARRLARSATASLPVAALVDSSPKATICVTSACDFDKWSTGLLLTQIVSALHHLYTVFDAATAVFGVDQGGSLGDEYVVTCGLVRGSRSNGSHAAFFALWQQSLREASIVALRSCIATGELVGGVVGGSVIRYIVHGQALDVATTALHLVPPGMVWCTESTISQIAVRAPGLFAACPEVAAAGLFSLHPTGHAFDPREEPGRHDDSTTVRTESVLHSMRTTQLWLAGHQRAAHLSEERRSAAFLVGHATLLSVNSGGIRVVADSATDAASVDGMLDFARLAVNLKLAGAEETEAATPVKEPKASRKVPSAREAWQQPHQPCVRPLRGLFEQESDEAAYATHTGESIRRLAPSALAAAAVLECCLLLLYGLEHTLVDGDASPRRESARDIAAAVMMVANIVFLCASGLFFRANQMAVAPPPNAPGAAPRPVLETATLVRVFGAVCIIGGVTFMSVAAVAERSFVFWQPLFLAAVVVSHISINSTRIYSWPTAVAVLLGISVVPCTVALAMRNARGMLETIGSVVLLVVLAGLYAWRASQRYRCTFCIAYDVRAKAAAVQECVSLLQGLAMHLLPPHVVELGLSSVTVEARRSEESGEAAMSAQDRLNAVQRIVHHIEPTDRLADCVAVRVQFESVGAPPPPPHGMAAWEAGAGSASTAYFTRWAQVSELLRVVTQGKMQLVETLGDSLLIAGPFAGAAAEDVFQAAAASVAYLLEVRTQLRLSFTATCVIDEAFGSLVGRGTMRYAVLGVAVRHAHALLTNAPRRPGIAVAYLSRTFRDLLVDEGVRRRYLPAPLPYNLLRPQRWAVRSVGLTYVWPLIVEPFAVTSPTGAADLAVAMGTPHDLAGPLHHSPQDLRGSPDIPEGGFEDAMYEADGFGFDGSGEYGAAPEDDLEFQHTPLAP